MTFAAAPSYDNIPSSNKWDRNTSTSQSAVPNHIDLILLEVALDECRRILFDSYVDAWLKDTEWHSSISSITRHPNFGAIVQMGVPAMRFMFERMQSGDIRVHWFPALKDISGGADPVPQNERGRVSKMADRWIDWGKRRGYA